MKRTDFYIKLTTAILFIAVVFYIGVYIFISAMTTYETATAIRYTVEQTLPAHGYIVRSEIVLSDPSLVVLPIVGDGEKVASGQAIAVEYLSQDALGIAGEIRELRLKIEQIEAISESSSAEAVCLDAVMDLSKAVQRCDFARLDELTLSIESVILSGNSSNADNLPALKARLETLQNAAGGARYVYAPVSGTFSQVVDGFENIGPGALADITPSGLASLFETPLRASGAVKLVTEFKWYYAAVMSVADASRLYEVRSIPVQFTGAYVAAEEMQVEGVFRREAGECVVLFSSTRGVHDIAPHRRLSADVVYNVITGLRVPQDAIRLDDDGATYIYIQTGARAERVDVEILRDDAGNYVETGDSYLVRDGAETGSPLRAGSTVIVKANNLFDGKIVG